MDRKAVYLLEKKRETENMVVVTCLDLVNITLHKTKAKEFHLVLNIISRILTTCLGLELMIQKLILYTNMPQHSVLEEDQKEKKELIILDQETIILI